MWANLSGSGVVDDQTYGYWSGPTANLLLAVRKGDPAAGTSSGVTFDLLTGPVAFDNAGKIAFGATLVGSGVTAPMRRDSGRIVPAASNSWPVGGATRPERQAA